MSNEREGAILARQIDEARGMMSREEYEDEMTCQPCTCRQPVGDHAFADRLAHDPSCAWRQQEERMAARKRARADGAVARLDAEVAAHEDDETVEIEMSPDEVQWTFDQVEIEIGTGNLTGESVEYMVLAPAGCLPEELEAALSGQGDRPAGVSDAGSVPGKRFGDRLRGVCHGEIAEAIADAIDRDALALQARIDDLEYALLDVSDRASRIVEKCEEEAGATPQPAPGDSLEFRIRVMEHRMERAAGEIADLKATLAEHGIYR